MQVVDHDGLGVIPTFIGQMCNTASTPMASVPARTKAEASRPAPAPTRRGVGDQPTDMQQRDIGHHLPCPANHQGPILKPTQKASNATPCPNSSARDVGFCNITTLPCAKTAAQGINHRDHSRIGDAVQNLLTLPRRTHKSLGAQPHQLL